VSRRNIRRGEDVQKERCHVLPKLTIRLADDGQRRIGLLAYPLEHVVDREQIARDLDYYATVIDPNGPAMSFSVYSIVSAQLGRMGDAYDYLKRAYVPNTKQPYYAFSETPENNEYFFCTGVGGALQGLLFGFTGLRLREGGFVLNPQLAPGWTAFRLRGLFLIGRTDRYRDHTDRDDGHPTPGWRVGIGAPSRGCSWQRNAAAGEGGCCDAWGDGCHWPEGKGRPAGFCGAVHIGDSAHRSAPPVPTELDAAVPVGCAARLRCLLWGDSGLGDARQ